MMKIKDRSILQKVIICLIKKKKMIQKNIKS